MALQVRENSPCRRQFRVIVCLEYAISSEWKLVQSTAMTYGSKNVMAFQQNCLSRMWQLPAFVWQERCWKRWRSTLDGMDLRMSQIRHFHFGGMHCSSCEAVPVTMGSNSGSRWIPNSNKIALTTIKNAC